MEALRAYLGSQPFSPAELDQILACFTPKQFRKDDYFLREGQVSTHLAFIEKGTFQYFVLHEGEERTTYVGMENTFLASLLSFLYEAPSREYIRALSACEVQVISKTDLNRLRAEIPSFKDFYIALLEYQICCIDTSRFDLLMLSAEQRYENLLEQNPELLQQASLGQIASMLGVTPRHLSRLRRNVR